MGLRNEPDSEGGDLGWVNLEAPLANHLPQEGNRGHIKLALLSLHEEVVLPKPLEDHLDMVDMFLLGSGVDKDVIQVDEEKFLSWRGH